MTKSRTQVAGPALADVLRHHKGAGDRIRTRDIFFTREALYQLSYTGDAACAAATS